MKKSIVQLCLLTALSGAGLPFTFSGFAQGARMLPKGVPEMSVGYTGLTGFGEDDLLSQLGAGFGIGITERVNFRIRYSRLFSDEFDGLNLVSFTPKFALKQHKISATLPVSILFAEGESIWAASPGFQFSVGKANTSELTIGTRCDIPFSDEIDGVLLSLNVGGGFSRDLDLWAIRPEVGVLFFSEGDEPVFSFGLGANFSLVRKK